MDVGSVNGIARLAMPSEAQATTTSSKTVAAQLQSRVENREPGLTQGWDAVIRALEGGNKVQMEFDREINRVVVRIVSGRTEETIAQYPPEDLLSFMKKFKQYMNLSIEGV